MRGKPGEGETADRRATKENVLRKNRASGETARRRATKGKYCFEEKDRARKKTAPPPDVRERNTKSKERTRLRKKTAPPGLEGKATEVIFELFLFQNWGRAPELIN